jgi:hypothetical protein
MKAVRSLAAILAGFWFMVFTVKIGTIVGSALFLPGGLAAPPPSAFPAPLLAILLLVSALGGVFGGWLAARIAPVAPFGHAVVLAIAVGLLLFGVMAGASAQPQPRWYPAAAGLMGVAGVLLGGKLRASAAATAGHVVA